jgi:hypothetical protein
MEYTRTAHNRSVSARFCGAGLQKTAVGAYAPLRGFSPPHFAVAGNLRFPLSQPQKCRKQPERYVK